MDLHPWQESFRLFDSQQILASREVSTQKYACSWCHLIESRNIAPGIESRTVMVLARVRIVEVSILFFS